jgi:predicted amidophosphoribosyltransferase
MVTPRPGPGVCEACFNLTRGFDRCYNCEHRPDTVAVVVPISYSVAHEQLHKALAGYKRDNGRTARWLAVELASVLWRFLAGHERCVALAAHTDSFSLVTTVPSSDRGRDESHPLRRMVGELVGRTRDRHERLLRRSSVVLEPREFSAHKYEPLRRLTGESVLLIDDTWTTGASARSAAAALQSAGAGSVGAVVIGRHVNRNWGRNDEHLRSLPAFDWKTCALCAGSEGELAVANAS